MPKKVTLEDLAQMTGKGFGETNEKLGSLNQKVTQLNVKVDKEFKGNRKDHVEILVKLTETVNRNEFLEMEQRLRKVEAKLGLIS